MPEENNTPAEFAVGDKVETNIPQEKPENSEKSGSHYGLIAVSAVVLAAGVAGYIIGNYKAKDTYDGTKDGLASKADYDSAHDDISKYQTIRAVGLGAAIVGGVGLILSIAF